MNDLISRQAVLDGKIVAVISNQTIEVVPVSYICNIIPQSPSRPQWIPCSNRLPEVTVLCCDTRGEMIIGYPYQDEESNTGYSAVLDDIVMIDCTAWMPLPEPYHRP